MTLVSAERPLLPQSDPPDAMNHGIALSAALHVVLCGVIVFGLPTLFHPSEPQEMPIAVALVTVGPETRATHPNPYMPRREAKPVPAEADAPTPLPKVKPEPPQPAPPPSAEQPPAPTPPPPEPKPEAPQIATAPPLPVPKPEPKPTPPKVETPVPPLPREKPAPPQLAKYEPRAQEKKYDALPFQALLKNLAAQAAVPDPAARPQKPQAVSLRASSQPKAPLGSELTTSEIDLVREQISRCWNVPAGAKDARDLVVEIRVAVDPGGMVQQAMIVDQTRANADPFFRAAAESARRAFFNPLCRPLRLPAEKYAIWKDLVVNFSPRDLL